MRPYFMLIKREWWEWRRTILWTVGIFTVLLALSMIPAARMSKHFESVSTSVDFSKGDGEIIINGMDILPEIMEHGSMGALENTLRDDPEKVLVPYSISLISGFHGLQILILFIALFYFSDSLYKERSDGSTLFYRSQPVGDHLILSSKIVSGVIGILGVSMIMSIILLIFAKLNLMVLSSTISDLLLPVFSRIGTIDLFKDMMVFQFVALLWLSPFILFLILISSVVKNRPLIIGIGAPILLAVFIQLIFGNHELFNLFGEMVKELASIQTEQRLLEWDMRTSSGSIEIFGSFSSYIFTLRTFVSLVIAGGFYGLTWMSYRKNIPTS